jgi:hypothetical protein
MGPWESVARLTERAGNGLAAVGCAGDQVRVRSGEAGVSHASDSRVRSVRDRCGGRCRPAAESRVRSAAEGRLCSVNRVARESVLQSVRGFIRNERSDRPGGMPRACLGFVRRACEHTFR